MTTAILQARTNSSRLPGKVLKPILGVPMVLRQLERLQFCKEIDTIVVATSSEPTDDFLAEIVSSAGFPVVRGPLDDVLQRFVFAAQSHPAQNIVRLTADCPLADAPIIDEVIRQHKRQGNDYTSNTQPRTFPRGLDVEVFNIKVLESLSTLPLTNEEKEHVTLRIYNSPGQYILGNFSQKPNKSEHRWTVDLEEDFYFVSKIYEKLYNREKQFWQQDIYDFLSLNPAMLRYEKDASGH
jgi:spore coat polysaccharide biosynthesis protein SpsF